MMEVFVVTRRYWTKILRACGSNGQVEHARGRSEPGPPTALNVCWHGLGQIIHHRSTLQRNKNAVCVPKFNLCREYRGVSYKTAPQGFPSSFPKFRLQRRYDIAIQSQPGNQLAVLPVPSLYQHRVIHATVFQVLHASQSRSW